MPEDESDSETQRCGMPASAGSKEKNVISPGIVLDEITHDCDNGSIPASKYLRCCLDVANHKRPHLGAHRQYWRDIILGVNDGLVSTFLLVAGVAGSDYSSSDILLTAIAGAIAGAVSMCAGEYVATKSQNEVVRGEIALERLHVNEFPEEELSELGDLLSLIGIPVEEAAMRNDLQEFYSEHPESLLKIMTALEFGFVSAEERSPLWAGLTSCTLFIIGSLPSVLPFAFSADEPIHGLIVAASITTFSLLVVGAVKTWATRGSYVTAAIENLVIAGFGGAFAYGVGVLFDDIVH